MSTKHHAHTVSAPVASATTLRATPATAHHVEPPLSRTSLGLALSLLVVVIGYGLHKVYRRIQGWRFYRLILYRPKGPAFLDRKNWGTYCKYWEKPQTKNGVHGNARLAYISELAEAGYFPSVGIPLGRSLEFPITNYTKTGLGPWIRFAKDGHGMLFSPPGGGKFRDVLAAMMLYPETSLGNFIFVDPKCQISVVTYPAMNSNGRTTVYINSFEMYTDTLGPSIGYNPMASMDPTTKHFAVDCDSLADAIVVYSGGETYFIDSAKVLISGLIYYFRKYGKPDEQDLVSVRIAIGLPPAAFRELIATMAAKGDLLLTEKISRFIGMQDDDREALGILGSAKTETAFIGNEAVRETLKGKGNFSFKDLRTTPGLSVGIILPGEYLTTCSKLFRIVIASALRELLANREGITVNIAIDEFPALGPLRVLEDSLVLLRGYGIRLFPLVCQDIPQIRRLYPDSWETFLSSASVLQFLNVRDMFTAEWIERRSGKSTAKTHGTNFSHNPSGTSTGTNTGEFARPAILAQEAMSLGDHEQIIFAAGVSNAIIAQRLPYWDIKCLKGTFLDDPYHTKPRPAKAAAKALPAPAPKLLPAPGKST